jgi:hypothetical protein
MAAAPVRRAAPPAGRNVAGKGIPAQTLAGPQTSNFETTGRQLVQRRHNLRATKALAGDRRVLTGGAGAVNGTCTPHGCSTKSPIARRVPPFPGGDRRSRSALPGTTARIPAGRAVCGASSARLPRARDPAWARCRGRSTLKSLWQDPRGAHGCGASTLCGACATVPLRARSGTCRRGPRLGRRGAGIRHPVPRRPLAC